MIYRVKTNSISIGQTTWNQGALISAERLGVLVGYFLKLGLIEEASFKRVDELDPAMQTAA